jgi:hypothetical protein
MTKPVKYVSEGPLRAFLLEAESLADTAQDTANLFNEAADTMDSDAALQVTIVKALREQLEAFYAALEKVAPEFEYVRGEQSQ